VQERRRKAIQAIHAHCFHTILFFLSSPTSVICRVGWELSGVAFTQSTRSGRALPLRFVGVRVVFILLARYNVQSSTQQNMR
jgi:hypothetical protein